MADTLTPSQRSERMSLVRAKDTKPEMNARRAAHRLGYRFRLHRRDLPGKPDMVFPRLRKIVLVHGCFWHQHEGCGGGRMPKSRPEFWQPKLARNVERDGEVRAALEELGWDVMVLCVQRQPT
jgi:DNA mismatch endonuclease (patch repair protein)